MEHLSGPALYALIAAGWAGLAVSIGYVLFGLSGGDE